MSANFDNIDDVVSKFTGTICYYERKPILIKQCSSDPDKPGKFSLLVTSAGGRAKAVNLDDPNFSFKDYNLGYANNEKIAAWWFRWPVKQYRQGLKKDQLGVRVSNPHMLMDGNFGFSKPYINMLENVYPDIKMCAELLREQNNQKIIAFHKNFALSYDEMHEDFIVEYKAKKIGVSTNKQLTEFRLTKPFEHLNEVLQEAIA